ncbi:MAG: Asp-tRNA(Asn)/Glu-tRNA(Gln) amidotransferase subunit GatA [bacterium]
MSLISISELNKKFTQKPDSILDNMQKALIRIDEAEDEVNALVTVAAKEAIVDAKTSVERYASKKPLSAIDGIVVTIKDVFCTDGIRTTASSKMLEEFVPVYDATVVSKLKEAGAIMVGKNNCDAWAHGASTENSDYGVTKNPWDLTRVSGGSSGGSAAAVALGECDFSIGSDTGGSIRQPAGFCGVVGLKPTYGRVSRYGLIAMASSLDCVGPLAKSTVDVAQILEVIAGHDEKDSTSVNIPVPKYTELIDKPLRGKKIGWAKEYFDVALNKEIKSAIENARDEFIALGAEIVDISLPNIKYGVPVYYIIQPAEVSSNLGRYDGIKYGYSTENSENLIDHYFKSRDEGFGAEAKRRIMLGTFVLSAGYYDAYYNKAMKVRTLIKQDFEKAFENVDIILSPVSPTTAFKIGEKTADPMEMYLADVYTAAINLSGNPALSLPCGFDSNKLPIGMQIIGKHFDESLVLNFGNMYEKKTEKDDWRGYKTVV